MQLAQARLGRLTCQGLWNSESLAKAFSGHYVSEAPWETWEKWRQAPALEISANQEAVRSVSGQLWSIKKRAVPYCVTRTVLKEKHSLVNACIVSVLVRSAWQQNLWIGSKLIHRNPETTCLPLWKLKWHFWHFWSLLQSRVSSRSQPRLYISQDRLHTHWCAASPTAGSLSRMDMQYP